MAGLARRGGGRMAGGIAVAVAWACAGEPPIVEVTVGYGGGDQPNAITLAARDLDASRRSGEPAIVFGIEPRREPHAPLRLTDEVEAARRAARRSTVVAVVGPGGSREASQSAPVYARGRLPQILPTATSRSLPAAGPWTFRLAPDDSIQGQFIGSFVADRLGARAAVLFHIPDEYGAGLATGIVAALERRGVRLIIRSPVPPSGLCPPADPANAYDDQVAQGLRRGTPDAVIVAGRSRETGCIARAVRERGWRGPIVAGDGVTLDARFVALAGAGLDSMFLVGFWHRDAPDTASRSFVARFAALTGRSAAHGDAMWYDAAMLAGTAIRRSDGTREGVRRYLEALGSSATRYSGVTGPIDFARPRDGRLIMARVRGTETELVFP